MLEKLLGDKKIEKVKETGYSLEQPLKDLEFAKKGLGTKNYNRIMAIAYEAVLIAGNGLMNFLGYRTIGKEHHKNLFEFLREIDINQELVQEIRTFVQEIRTKNKEKEIALK